MQLSFRQNWKNINKANHRKQNKKIKKKNHKKHNQSPKQNNNKHKNNKKHSLQFMSKQHKNQLNSSSH